MAELPEPPVTAPRREASVCWHKRVRLDPDARRAYCRGCGVEVDAFEALLDLAREFERHRVAEEAAERACREAEGRLEELKRRERNARARVARLEGREREARGS